MTKRLLFGLLAASASLSSFAVAQGDYVYTKDGAYSILTAPESVALTDDLAGWTAISATEGMTAKEIFMVVDGVANQIATSTSKEGMYYKFTATSSPFTIVSFKIRQEVAKQPFTTNVSYGQDGARGCYGFEVAGFNYVNVIGNTGGFLSTDGFASYGKEIMLSKDWQEVNFAVTEADGKDLYLIISGMESGVQIKDIQISGGIQMADMRKVENELKNANALLGAREWAKSDALDGLKENIEALQAITKESPVETYNEVMEGLTDAKAAFFESDMEDFLSSCGAKTDWHKNTSTSKKQKQTSWGDWSATGNSGRWFQVDGCSDITAIHAPHFGGVAGYKRGTSSCEMTKTLMPGTYYFEIGGSEWVFYNGTPYTGATKNYMKNLGLNKAEMTVYFKKDGEIVASNTVKICTSDAEVPMNNVVSAVSYTVPAEGEYVIGFATTSPFTEEELAYYGLDETGFDYGGSYAFVNQKIYCKLDGRSAAETAYIANVKAQVKAGRDNYDKALENAASDKAWGKAAVKEAADAKLEVLQKYEAMTEDEIGATFDKDTYVAGPTNENSLLEGQVYNELAKDLIAANKAFDDQNKKLESLAPAIKDAEAVRDARAYSASTGKAAFQAEIDAATELDKNMYATDYSEENAAAIDEEIAKLLAAADEYKAAVPADAVKTIVDIDFETPAVQNTETGLYSIAGAQGVMEFAKFEPTTEAGAKAIAYEQGMDSNGEKLFPGLIRVGNADATAAVSQTLPLSANDIVKVSFDYYFGALSGKNCGFYILDAEGKSIADYSACKYSGSYESNPMGIDLTKYNHVGSSSAANDKIADASNCTHFDVIIDYGRKSIYCQYGTNGAVNITDEIALTNLNPIASFVLRTNYNNADRRCWFDNLKISNVAAGPCEPFDPTNVSNVTVAPKVAATKALVNGEVVISVNGVEYNAAGAQK